MRWTIEDDKRDRDDKRARRAVEAVVSDIESSGLHCDTCSAQCCDGLTLASVDRLRVADSVHEAIREAVEREREATDALRTRVAELEAQLAGEVKP